MIIFSKLTALVQRRNERGKLSEETKAINRLVELITELKSEFGDNFIYTDENNNKVKPANYFRDIYEESRKQSQALQSFSTDLSTKIEAGFEKILNNPDKGVTHELQELKTAIEDLGNKIQDPTTEGTQKMVDELKSALGNMIGEFKTSMSGSVKSDLENIAKRLSEAGGGLTDFPAKLKEMTDNLNENFKGLQEVVHQIGEKLLSQSAQSIEQVGEGVIKLQSGQNNLISKQTENLKISDNLLKTFNTSIDKMTFLSMGITESISKFDEVKTGLGSTAGQLKIISENVNSSSNSFRDAQSRFSQHSNQFLETNAKTIEQIQVSLTKAKEVATFYSDRFNVIESGLKSIFEQIEKGLNTYKNTVGESLETYLGKYSEALTKTAESLGSASSMQEGILEELTEQLSKFKGR